MSVESVKYTLRVYAIIRNSRKEVLIADEYHFDMPMIKFPGGGMQLHEGVLEALQREAWEELQQPLQIGDLFYVTDFYLPNKFRPEFQLINIYYFATLTQEITFPLANSKFEKTPFINGSFAFRWVPVEALAQEDFTFDSDKAMVQKLIAWNKNQSTSFSS